MISNELGQGTVEDRVIGGAVRLTQRGNTRVFATGWV